MKRSVAVSPFGASAIQRYRLYKGSPEGREGAPGSATLVLFSLSFLGPPRSLAVLLLRPALAG